MPRTESDSPSARRSGPPASDPHPNEAHDPTLAFGWILIGVFLTMGLALGALRHFEEPLYVESPLRRELWSLAHAHGTLFGVLNVLFALSAPRWLPARSARVWPSRLLRASGILVPGGFLLGGLATSEADPPLGLVLTPLGGALALAAIAVALQLGASHRDEDGPER